MTTPDLDQLRKTDPAAAVEAYAGAPESIDPGDSETIGWIAEHSTPVVAPSLVPLLDGALERDLDCRRIVLQKLGATAWYGGDTDRAETLWRRAIDIGRPFGDDLFFRALNNLCLVCHSQARLAESLILAGVVEREATAPEQLRLRHFALRKRALVLATMLDALTDEVISECHAQLPGLEEDEQLTALTDILGIEQRWYLSQEKWADAVRASDTRIEALERMPNPILAIVQGAYLNRLRARFELEPENRAAILDECAEYPRVFALRSQWHRGWKHEYQLLLWRAALDRKDHDEARAILRELLDDDRNDGFYWDFTDRALKVAERHEFTGPEYDELIDRAASFMLERIVEAHRDADALPESVEATREDRTVIGRYQERLVKNHRGIVDRIARRWKPGDPTFDLLVQRELATFCAWCRRAKTNDGRWLAASELSFVERSARITHGICEDCYQSEIAGRR